MKEQLAIHGRYIHTVTGELKSCYLDILKPETEALEPNATEPDLDAYICVGASTITKHITESFAEVGLDTTGSWYQWGTMVGHRNRLLH